MFTITEAAAEQILHAAEAQPGEDVLPMLRLAAKVDEDGEISYGMGFDDERENDVKLESHGLTILIAPRSQELLAGATLDFIELQPGEYQFVFLNPNEPSPATAGCGSRGSGCGSCGSSGGNSDCR
jgi:iron-sulfur cluster assembly protein